MTAKAKELLIAALISFTCIIWQHNPSHILDLVFHRLMVGGRMLSLIAKTVKIASTPPAAPRR